MQCFCIGINHHNYTMSTSLQILKPLAADYDGDVLNIFMIISRAFADRAYQIFNPRNAMYISRSNGMLNKDVLVQRDTLINANTLKELASDNYSQDELATFNELAKRNKSA